MGGGGILAVREGGLEVTKMGPGGGWRTRRWGSGRGGVEVTKVGQGVGGWVGGGWVFHYEGIWRRVCFVYGPRVWPLCMALMYGPCVWPLCMALVYGPYVWPLCMDLVYGPYVWTFPYVCPLCMALMYGPCVWPLCMALMYGLPGVMPSVCPPPHLYRPCVCGLVCVGRGTDALRLLDAHDLMRGKAVAGGVQPELLAQVPGGGGGGVQLELLVWVRVRGGGGGGTA